MVASYLKTKSNDIKPWLKINISWEYSRFLFKLFASFKYYLRVDLINSNFTYTIYVLLSNISSF